MADEHVIRVRFAEGTESFVHGAAAVCKAIGEALEQVERANAALARAKGMALALYESTVTAPKTVVSGDDHLVPGGSS